MLHIKVEKGESVPQINQLLVNSERNLKWKGKISKDTAFKVNNSNCWTPNP